MWSLTLPWLEFLIQCVLCILKNIGVLIIFDKIYEFSWNLSEAFQIQYWQFWILIEQFSLAPGSKTDEADTSKDFELEWAQQILDYQKTN